MRAEQRREQQPGTLVWIGYPLQREFIDAFRFCREHAAQVAIRRSLRELVDRPAGSVQRIIIARSDRRPLPTRLLAALAGRYGDAQWLALTSAICDGETRSDEPWPVPLRRLRFSRWSERLPEWFGPCGNTAPSATQRGTLVVICDRYEMAEPYLEIAASQGRTSLWKRQLNRSSTRHVGSVLWDDSVATPTTTEQWRWRLDGSQRASVQHIWLVTQPHAAEIRAAIAGGISKVLTKPVAIDALFA